MLQAATLGFLKNLKKNNNKAWFESHRKDYLSAKEDIEAFIQTVIDRHAKKDESIQGIKAKDCLFRINRDVRFSKDKSPYKINFGASVTRGGKKVCRAGYYFHCEPGKSFVGGGIWMPPPEELKKVRQEIDYNLDAFKKIIGSKKFKAVYGDLEHDEEVSLKKVPQGYEKDNPAATYLKLKSFIAIKSLNEKELLSKDLIKITLEAMETLQPLLVFINHSLEV